MSNWRILLLVLSLLLAGPVPHVVAAPAVASDAAVAMAAAQDLPCHHDTDAQAAALAAAEAPCCGGQALAGHCGTAACAASCAVPLCMAGAAPVLCLGLVRMPVEPQLPRGRTVAPELPPPTA